jgi:ankyrin repeat protein
LYPTVDLNARDRHGDTALCAAAGENKPGIVRMLLDNPAVSVVKADNMGSTPLMLAVGNGYADIVKLLLARPEVDVNAEGCGVVVADNKTVKNDASALTLAVNIPPTISNSASDYAAVLELLLAREDLVVNGLKPTSGVPLHFAIRRQNNSAVQRLLRLPGIDVNKLDRAPRNCPPLTMAVCADNLEAFNMLLQHPNIQVNRKATAENDLTALMVAAATGKIVMLKALIEDPRVDVQLTDKNGSTATILAAANNQPEALEILLTLPSTRVNQASAEGLTCLHLVAKGGYKRCLDIILSRPDVDVNVKTTHGEVPVTIAVIENKVEIVAALAARSDVDINCPNHGGMNAIAQAVGLYSDTTLLRLLLASPRCRPNHVFAFYGCTELHMAIRDGKLKALEEMMRHPDINPNATYKLKTEVDITPLLEATIADSPAAVQCLLAHPRINPNVCRNGFTPLICAAMKGRHEIVRQLIAHAQTDLTDFEKVWYSKNSQSTRQLRMWKQFASEF